ncbi:LysR family transcriptional regulator [Kineococcus esterisolvens]|uniref:LysR family transcriptional regulator n=1 Tax=unclassified Kineococcus TaxID=2621656 RepID=UPI003D7E92A8
MKQSSTEAVVDELACLRALQAVRAHGTVTAAAGVLHLSPSALSQQIKRLERASGRTLTVASGRRVVLTPSAHALLEAALPLADQLDRVLTDPGPGEVGRQQAQVVGHVRVAAFTTALRAHVVSVLAGLRRTQPGLTWSLLEVDPDRALPALTAGAVDVAVVHHWRDRPAPVHLGLTISGAHHDPADVVCRRDDPLAGTSSNAGGDDSPGVEQLATRGWVSTGTGTVCHDWLLHMFARHHRRPDIVAEVPDFTLHLELVRHGLALALVPRMGRPPLHEELTTLALRDAPARVVGVATRSNQDDDPAISLLRAALLRALD